MDNIKFIVTSDGIRGAVKITPHKWGVIYLHRFDVANMLGLIKETDGSIKWDRLLDAYKAAEMYQTNDPGFSTPENKTSSKSIPSKYELQIPEYIRKEVIFFMAMKLNNPIAVNFQSKLVTEVIPFFEKYANPTQVANTPIIGQMNTVQNQFLCSGPMSMNVFQARKNILDSGLNQLAKFDQMVNGIAYANLTLDNLYDQLINWVDIYLYNNFTYNIHDCCYSMLRQYYSNPQVTKESIIDCIIGSDWLFYMAQHVIANAVIDIEIGAVERANNFGFKNKAKLENCNNTLEESEINTGKEVVKFEYQHNKYERPDYI